jgi:transporter family-2 protein
MEIFYLVLTAVAGATAPIQAGVNARLALWTKDPVMAALVSFAVGTVCLLGYVVAVRVPWPSLSAAWKLPWWIWTGGSIGAFIVVVTIITAPRLGAATMIACLVAGMMLAGLVLDHYGLVGYPVRETTQWRAMGAVLLTLGVVLIRRF